MSFDSKLSLRFTRWHQNYGKISMCADQDEENKNPALPDKEEKATKMNILENMTTQSNILQSLSWRKYSKECKIWKDPRLRSFLGI